MKPARLVDGLTWWLAGWKPGARPLVGAFVALLCSLAGLAFWVVGPRVEPGGAGQPDEAGGVGAPREHDRGDGDERRHPVAHLVAVAEPGCERGAHDLVDGVVAHALVISISRSLPPTAAR